MNLDELELLHRDVEAGWESASTLGAALHNAFPALLALARDGERYRWLRDNLHTGNDGDLPPMIYLADGGVYDEPTKEVLDAAIDAARKGEKP